ncbi:MAG: HAD family hydrolase [Acidobacteriota bacterium]
MTASPRLAVFDLDGTLTDTNEVDGSCFAAAFQQLFGQPLDEDWGRYPHTTDAAILDTALARLPAGADDGEGVERHRDRFVELLAAAPAECFRAIRGARDFLLRLRREGWALAIATGGWGRSARLKLERAGLADLELPLASADDGVARREIVEAARRRCGHPPATVLFGDGPWDVSTAGELELPVIAIASGQRARRLLAAGATAAFADYRRPEEMLRAMHRVIARPAPRISY